MSLTGPMEGGIGARGRIDGFVGASSAKNDMLKFQRLT
jgi:hypothetical protein